MNEIKFCNETKVKIVYSNLRKKFGGPRITSLSQSIPLTMALEIMGPNHAGNGMAPKKKDGLGFFEKCLDFNQKVKY